MSKKNKADLQGFVYSTDPNFQFKDENEDIIETAKPADQRLLIQLDRKQRGGKTVTLITGFLGTVSDLELLAKNLRNFCGTGGSAKDGEAIVQGDQRDKVLQWLIKNGFTQSKKK
ncbi:MAG: translation initiation factor [Sphingobacteriia bacterium]|nr:MAG: translation initiation factor [Sphingobacteriia bacterium]